MQTNPRQKRMKFRNKKQIEGLDETPYEDMARSMERYKKEAIKAKEELEKAQHNLKKALNREQGLTYELSDTKKVFKKTKTDLEFTSKQLSKSNAKWEKELEKEKNLSNKEKHHLEIRLEKTNKALDAFQQQLDERTKQLKSSQTREVNLAQDIIESIKKAKLANAKVEELEATLVEAKQSIEVEKTARIEAQGELDYLFGLVKDTTDDEIQSPSQEENILQEQDENKGTSNQKTEPDSKIQTTPKKPSRSSALTERLISSPRKDMTEQLKRSIQRLLADERRANLRDMENESSTPTSQVEMLEEELKITKEQTILKLKDKENEVQSLSVNLETLTTVIDEKDDKVKTLQEELQGIQSEMQESKNLLKQTSQRLSESQDDRLELEARIKDLQEELSTARDEASIAEASLKRLNETNEEENSLQKLIAVLQTDLQESNDGAVLKDEKITALEEKITTLVETVASLEADLELAKNQASLVSIQQKSTLNDLQTKLQNQKAAFDSISQELQESQNEVTNVKGKVIELEGKLEVSNQTVSQQKEGTNVLRAEKDKEIQSLSLNLDALKEEMNALKQSLVQSENNLKQTASEYSTSHQEASVLKTTLEEYKSSESLLKEQVQSLTIELDCTKEDLVFSERTNKILESELDAARKKIKEEGDTWMKSLKGLEYELMNYKDQTLDAESRQRSETDKLKNEYNWYDD